MLGVNAAGRALREASIVGNAGQKLKETRASAQIAALSKPGVNSLLIVELLIITRIAQSQNPANQISSKHFREGLILVQIGLKVWLANVVI